MHPSALRRACDAGERDRAERERVTVCVSCHAVCASAAPGERCVINCLPCQKNEPKRRRADALLGAVAAMAHLAQYARSGGQSGSRTATPSPTPAETDTAAAVLRALHSGAPEHIVGESMSTGTAPIASNALAHDTFWLAGAQPSTQPRASDRARHSRLARCACRAEHAPLRELCECCRDSA